MMERVTLYTRDGREVAQVDIPPFQLPAEGILWGERTFFRRDDGKYYEGLLYAVVPIRADPHGGKEAA